MTQPIDVKRKGKLVNTVQPSTKTSDLSFKKQTNKAKEKWTLSKNKAMAIIIEMLTESLRQPQKQFDPAQHLFLNPLSRSFNIQLVATNSNCSSEVAVDSITFTISNSITKLNLLTHLLHGTRSRRALFSMNSLAKTMHEKQVFISIENERSRTSSFRNNRRI